MTAHLRDAELIAFTAAELAPDDLLRADDHLSGCDQCRLRAATLSSSATHFDAFRGQVHAPTAHLSDEDLRLFVQGHLPQGAKDAAHRHLTDCATCARQVEDLRSWVAPASRIPFRSLAIAAAILLSVLIPGAIWQARVSRQTPSPSLAGLDALASPDQARVRAALRAGVATVPDFMADLNASREVLMGSPATRAGAFELVAPVGTGTVSDRPQFEWRPMPGADGYVVSVFDERSNLAARSPALTQPNWMPPDPLSRDRTYVWQVVAHRGQDTITAPVAPVPPAKFHVIDARTAAVLQRMEADHPQSHLLAGLLNMDAGIRDAAIRHLQQVPPTDAQADVARRSLERLQQLSEPGRLR